jgi:hypothetical protein
MVAADRLIWRAESPEIRSPTATKSMGAVTPNRSTRSEISVHTTTSPATTATSAQLIEQPIGRPTPTVTG